MARSASSSAATSRRCSRSTAEAAPTLAVPVGANNSLNASVVIGLTGAMGLATDLGDHVQLFTEVGALAVMDGNDVWFPRLDADAVVGIKLKLLSDNSIHR